MWPLRMWRAVSLRDQPECIGSEFVSMRGPGLGCGWVSIKLQPVQGAWRFDSSAFLSELLWALCSGVLEAAIEFSDSEMRVLI